MATASDHARSNEGLQCGEDLAHRATPSVAHTSGGTSASADVQNARRPVVHRGTPLTRGTSSMEERTPTGDRAQTSNRDVTTSRNIPLVQNQDRHREYLNEVTRRITELDRELFNHNNHYTHQYGDQDLHGPDANIQAQIGPPPNRRERRAAVLWANNPNPQAQHIQIQTHRCRKNTKASIKIAGLNIKGHGAINPQDPTNKWLHIKQMMRQRNVGILAVGEAHMDAERRANIEKIHGEQIRIFYSKLPDTANAAGVAIVLNKSITNVEGAQLHEVVAGHALLLETNWHNSETLSVLAIYAPNASPQANAGFYDKIRDFFNRNRNIRKPDIMIGDFNNVEDPIDRLPARRDPEVVTDALDSLKTQLQLIDGWRNTYPNSLKYTYEQPHQQRHNSHSRLDRAYCTSSALDFMFEWKIEHSGIATDHLMISVRFTNEKAPDIGKGRWTFPPHLMYDKVLKEYMNSEGVKLENKMRELDTPDVRTPENNKQRLWADYQSSIRQLARERAKIVVPKMSMEIRELEAKIDLISNDSTLTDHDRSLSTSVLNEKLATLMQRRHKATRESAKARNMVDGETISRYWTGINKSKAPRSLIHRLEKPKEEQPVAEGPVDSHGDGPTQPDKLYESHSGRMADMLASYHGAIQHDKTPPDETERTTATANVLSRVSAQITAEHAQRLKTKLTENDVREALQLSANNKAPGVNGIAYETWKILDGRFINARAHGKQAFDIIKALCETYNDIETHGLLPGTNFAESWMCPLYKKNDRAIMANYRPISLLNTDYKIMTKALTIKLARAAPEIVHPAQAGFIPGRHIFDQIWLTKLIINLAEVTETNGVIVALDQEKAYDKIKHDYLWKALRSFGIPEDFIQTVKTLYSDAHTSVVVNGMQSNSRFQVTRGVRQGDPLSCLLFDIAIEPLAISLRKSTLKGFDIPGKTERLIATFFADDTTVYLSKDDDFGDLELILDEWCLASGAKFNIGKTELIPIGSPEHRRAMRQTRHINGTDGTKIPEHIKIALEGEAIRTLGALIGNNICQITPWAKVLEKIDKALEQWDKSKPTMEGRRLILTMVVGGMTQYLTKVQGMPPEIERKLEKRIRNFLWDDKSHVTVNKETIYAPIEDGGRQLLDIISRNEAITVTWLQSYLDLSPDRATWAYVADEIIARNFPKIEKHVEMRDKVNIFLQSWNTKTTKLPTDLRNMLKVAKEYGVRLEAIAFSREILRQMPLWHHIEAAKTRRSKGDKVVRCLKQNHGVVSVGEAETLARMIRTANHRQNKNCKCDACKGLRSENACECPYRCIARARNLLLALPPKWNPLSTLPEDLEPNVLPQAEGDELIFDWRVTTRGTLSDAFRIFTYGDKCGEIPRLDVNLDSAEKTTVFTDGSCTDNGGKNARAGAGVYCEDDESLIRAIRVPNDLKQTNQTGEIIGINEAVRIADKAAELTICSDSKTSLNSLTRNLRKLEDRGFIGSENTKELRSTIARMRSRKAITQLKWVKGHAGIDGNERADALADEGRRKADDSDFINLHVDQRLRLTGAKLNAMSQSRAYKAIRTIKMHSETYRDRLDRRSTLTNLERVRDGALKLTGSSPSDKLIWKSLRKKDFSRQIRYFLWMCMHEAYKIGSYWSKIPTYEHRGQCTHCDNADESMEHILTDCLCAGQSEIWCLAEELWKKTGLPWVKPDYGVILALGFTAFKDSDGKARPGESRLYRIIVSESAHLIWKLRCNRVINGSPPPTPREIRGKWYLAIGNRLRTDGLLTSGKYGCKKLSRQLVLRTWNSVIEGGANLPDDWIGEAVGLVGKRAGVG